MAGHNNDNLNTLTKDGISEELFRLLWSKDELNFGPALNIPDTIVYKYGQPTAWYFTSVSGRIKRKNKHNLISAKIEETFNKHVLGYDVLGYFISFPSDMDSENNVQVPTIIEYLDREGLNNFLYNRKKDVNGILQRFIEPKTTKNEVIRAIWSPKLCLLERAENIHQLHDNRFGLYERCVIYEGPEYYFTCAPLRGPVLSGQIQRLSEAIISHISEVTFGQKQVSRIVLNFKVDSRDKIWLLYSTSIRSTDLLEYTSSFNANQPREETSLLNIDRVITISNTIQLNPIRSYDKIQKKERIRCLSCARETLEDMRHPVTLKSVIKHYDHVLHLLAEGSDLHNGERCVIWPPDAELIEAAGGVGFGCLFFGDNGDMMSPAKIQHQFKPKPLKDLQIPPIIHNIHYKLNAKSYQQCKNDPLFLFKTVKVCEPCYLVYAEFTTMLLRLGQDLTKLLTPDPIAANYLLQQQANMNRPSSAEWRAVGSTGSMAGDSKTLSAHSNQPGKLKPSANHVAAKKSAIGLRSQDSRTHPEVPHAVRTANDGLQQMSTISSEYGGFGSSLGSPFPDLDQKSPGTHSSPIPGGSASIGSSMDQTTDEEEMKAMIAERERHFFKEISQNPNLKDQHPLMHLISAQQKLKLVDEQSGVMMSKAASQSESVFGSKYGKQTGDSYKKYSCYGTEMPYTIGGEIVLPSTLRQRKKEEAKERMMKKKASFRASFMVQQQENEAKAMETSADSITFSSEISAASNDPNSQASRKHMDFLTESLKMIEEEMQTSGNSSEAKSKGKKKKAGRSMSSASAPLLKTNSASEMSANSANSNASSVKSKDGKKDSSVKKHLDDAIAKDKDVEEKNAEEPLSLEQSEDTEGAAVDPTPVPSEENKYFETTEEKVEETPMPVPVETETPPLTSTEVFPVEIEAPLVSEQADSGDAAQIQPEITETADVNSEPSPLRSSFAGRHSTDSEVEAPEPSLAPELPMADKEISTIVITRADTPKTEPNPAPEAQPPSVRFSVTDRSILLPPPTDLESPQDTSPLITPMGNKAFSASVDGEGATPHPSAKLTSKNQIVRNNENTKSSFLDRMSFNVGTYSGPDFDSQPNDYKSAIATAQLLAQDSDNSLLPPAGEESPPKAAPEISAPVDEAEAPPAEVTATEENIFVSENIDAPAVENGVKTDEVVEEELPKETSAPVEDIPAAHYGTSLPQPVEDDSETTTGKTAPTEVKTDVPVPGVGVPVAESVEDIVVPPTTEIVLPTVKNSSPAAEVEEAVPSAKVGAPAAEVAEDLPAVEMDFPVFK